MALDLTGIQNVEFYSSHYLDAVLEGDLKSVLDRWRKEKDEDGKRPPWEKLNGLANRYFSTLAKAEGERDEAERFRLARDFHAHLIEALGYSYEPAAVPLDGDEVCPVLCALRRDGRPFLWIVDAPFTAAEDDDPLGAKPLKEQLPQSDGNAPLPDSTWRELLDERLFLDRPPRWVLFLAGRQALLIERHKWSQGRYLSFDFGDLFSRRQSATLRATAGLLHREVLAPEDGLCLHDALDENSHKHAYAVSGDLKHGVRRAVELLANEAVYYRRETQKQAVFTDAALAEKLTTECLTWLYRLLFLFYVEARGAELGVVPMGTEVYRKGYSLETLRDLELVPLTTEHARNGTYLHDSLRRLFDILNGGFPAQIEEGGTVPLAYHDTMNVSPLNSPLFDDERLEILKGVKFRNFVLQEVLQLLSLSAEKKRKTRGRISYAQLGINQLGAVYEGLLSYTGFFADEDLYEVASERDCKQLSGKSAVEREALKTYFVRESRIGDYKESEIVKDENGKKIVHKKGTYIFRLAGRNREKSASYYTPEVLTKCLVKYALKELLWEEGQDGEEPKRKKTADEILALTICEPAMGSSAFLIEAVDQLADAYLEARQEELGETVPPEEYQREKRRVKARLATNNCYGVDLNPTAVELAKVSLWLATLYEGGKCPWFGLRLATGNSLIGARREVFKTVDVTRKGTKDNPNWLGLVPEPVPLQHSDDVLPPDEVDWANWIAPTRPEGTIYHFLLPAEGMAAFDGDKVIKQLAPESVKRIKEWRKGFCKPFNRKDAERLEQISDAVDRLFTQVVRERVLAAQETSDRIPVWGEQQSDEGGAQLVDLLVQDQEEVAASLEEGSSAYRRLKLAMDAWCALWFWPIEEAGLLPNRAAWLAQMELILKGQVTYEPTFEQGDLFAVMAAESQGESKTSQRISGGNATTNEGREERLKRLQALSDAFRERRADYLDQCGIADIAAVLEDDACLRSAQATAERLHFHHWALRFAEVFASTGGFDLMVGNPPWVKVEWNERGLISDYDATVEIRGVTAAAIAADRSSLLRNREIWRVYQQELSETQGTQEFISAEVNYPLLQGMHTNLYKTFVAQSWRLVGPGVTAFLHPEGVYDDPSGGVFREHLYPRLRRHFQFINELRLFSDVHNQVKFSVNVCDHGCRRTCFDHVANLFHPGTIDECYSHDGRGRVPAIRDAQDQFERAGHRGRVLRVDKDELSLFAKVYDTPGTPALRARLPVLHSVELLSVLAKLGGAAKIGPPGEEWATTREWNEADRKSDGVIARDTHWPELASGWVVQGPHIYCANPLYQTPNEICESNRAYTRVDLTSIPRDFLPRTNYRQDPSCEAYRQRLPSWKGRAMFDYFRHAHRAMVSPTNERSLAPCLLPRGAPSVHGVFTAAFSDSRQLVTTSAVCSSLVLDFFAKTLGKVGLGPAEFREFPMPLSLDEGAVYRVLALNCVTEHYADLWREAYRESWRDEVPTNGKCWHASIPLSAEWRPEYAMRTDADRRQALVEIDVLVARAFEMTLEELIAIYVIQFGVLRQYERQRLYDSAGRVIPGSKTAGGNPAVSLVELAATLKEEAGFDVNAEYGAVGSNTEELRRQRIRLGRREADVLGVSERCTMAELLGETEVRRSNEDHPEDRPVHLVGLRYTDPGLEPHIERVYPTPWMRCDREADYRQAWVEFERRLGKNIPGGMRWR